MDGGATLTSPPTTTTLIFQRKVSAIPFKTVLSAISLIALALNSAHASDADFTLTNRTGHHIESVHIAPTKQIDWGNDHLGKSVQVSLIAVGSAD
jgi:hypothetical protein